MKKKILSSLMLCLMAMGQAQASDVLTVAAVTIPQGREAILTVDCEFELQFKAYQFDIELPEGLSLVVNEGGKPVCELGFEGTDHTVSSSVVDTGKYRFVCTSTSNALLPTSGTLLKVKVIGGSTVAVGNNLKGKVTNIEFTAVNYDVTNLENVEFPIIIVEAQDTRVVLDETSPDAPEASDGAVDVLVKRTIKANEWSTICLPFDMSEEQLKEVFGNDVQLAEFIDYEVDYEGNIIINFEDALSYGLWANYPYLIKASADISEFTITAEIDPDPDNAIARYDNGRPVNHPKYELYGSFTGVYQANTVVPENCLFISGNKFWYSTGLTKMKAFRGYFWLEDVLSDVEQPGSRISFSFKEATGIHSLTPNPSPKGEGSIYDLQGRRVENPGRKGLYINNGKKVVVK